MGIDKKQAWILGLLGIILLAVWIRAFTVRPVHSHNPAGPKVSNPRQPPEAVSAGSASSSAGAHFQDWADSPFLMDRGQPQDGEPISATTPGEYSLSGILWDPRAPSAIVDNRVVNVGDQIGPWRIVEIQRDRVILSNGEETKTLQSE